MKHRSTASVHEESLALLTPFAQVCTCEYSPVLSLVCKFINIPSLTFYTCENC